MPSGYSIDPKNSIFNKVVSRITAPVDPLQQMLDLEMQAIDAKYSGQPGGSSYSGGGSGAGSGIATLQKFGDQGDSKLAELYGNLGTYLQGSANDTDARYASAEQNVGGYYDQGSKDIASTADAVKKQIMDQAALSPAGQAAGTNSEALANAAIQRQAAIEQTNKSNALSSLQSLQTGHAAINKEIMAGAAQEGTAQRARLKDIVAAQVAQAQAQAAASRARYVSSGTSNQGKADAEKLKTEAKYIGLEQKQQQSSQVKQSQGLQRVIQYAQQQGQPELADKFMKMLSGARQTSAQSVVASRTDPAGLTKSIDPKTQFLLLLGKSGIEGNPTYDKASGKVNTDLIDLIMKDPEFSKYKKYLKTSPLYNQATDEKSYGSVKGLFGKTIKDSVDKKMQQTVSQIPRDLRFTLAGIPDSEYNNINDLIQKRMQEGEILNQMYNLYTGGI